MIVVRCNRIIDPYGEGRVLVDHGIYIDKSNGRIANILPWSKCDPSSSSVIDWSSSSLTVVPGLIDLHTHVADACNGGYHDPLSPLKYSEEATLSAAQSAGHAMLTSGFTTVRDCGCYRGLLDVKLRDKINKGELEGPRMIVAGAYITTYGGGGDMPHDGPPLPSEFQMGIVQKGNNEEVRLRVRELIGKGVDFIKLIVTGAVLAVGSTPNEMELTVGQVRAAVEEANKYGKYCVAHAHGREGILASIEGGCRSVEHCSYLDSVGIDLIHHSQHADAPPKQWLVMDIFNAEYIDEGKQRGMPDEYLQKNRQTADVQRAAFTAAVRKGVHIGFGTDAGVIPFGISARQFPCMVKYGMTPLQAIQSATIVAAEILGMEKDIGAVREGWLADFVCVEGNPLEDVECLSHVCQVMKGGKMIERAREAK